jgi:hypothetical protein
MRRHFARILLLTALAAVPACEKQGGATDVALKQVPVQMALSIGGNSVDTKADVSVIKELQATPVFSGLGEIRLLPFPAADKTTALKNSIPRLSINYGALAENSNAYYFGQESGSVFTIPRETASFLVYGKAQKGGNEETDPEVSFKHLNGSLLEEGFNAETPQPAAIKFSPDMMLSSGATPSDATVIADVLTAVVVGSEGEAPFSVTAYYNSGNTYSVPVPWDETIGDDNLRTCFENITAGGALMPGSGTNVASMLTNLYRTVSAYNIINSYQYEVEKDGTFYPATKENGDPLTYGDLYNYVRGRILARFTTLAEQGKIRITGNSFSTYTVSFADMDVATYPERLGLPSGAAVVRWTPLGYKVPLENGLDGIAPISAYCYPPSLYYYADTEIRTSEEEIEYELYGSNYSWATILGNYTAGNVVTSRTRAVVLENPLHYGMGMLRATIMADAEKLQDNDGQEYTLVEVSGQKFPLTGVIIGRQYRQNYDFTPVEDENASQCYLYDDRMPEIYLTTTRSASFSTLALETPENKDTYFCLEFRNDSEESFHGAEGRILPGHKFYLVGKLAVPAGGFTKAFTKDHVTMVNCTIKSLKEAHSAVPDMGIPFLSLGVETQVNWTMSEPITLIME